MLGYMIITFITSKSETYIFFLSMLKYIKNKVISNSAQLFFVRTNKLKINGTISFSLTETDIWGING